MGVRMSFFSFFSKKSENIFSFSAPKWENIFFQKKSWKKKWKNVDFFEKNWKKSSKKTLKVDFRGGKQIILFFKKNFVFLRFSPLNVDFLIFLKKNGKKRHPNPHIFYTKFMFLPLYRGETEKRFGRKKVLFFVYRPYIRWSTRNWPPCNMKSYLILN